ncbi:hypothetical protein C0989_001950 [Termitomyces sp. Mn162]|nr:hypothetical protein C0989_001950 [Termitomyces sp. Mn162]
MFDFKFPPEIEDRIFEWAAFLLPCDACHLAVTCKRLQIRVEYIMYESLLFAKEPYRGIPETADVKRFEYTLKVRPAEFFATRVRNICIMFNVNPSFAKSVIAKCTGARCVACWTFMNRPSGYGTLFLPLTSTLVGISTNKYTVNEMAASGIAFPHVQYLGLMGEAKEPLLPLDWLPNLLTMQVDLNNPRSDQWLEDTKLAISTALFLEMVIFDVNPGFLDEVESRRPELGEEAAIWIRNREFEHGIYKWRGFAYKDEMIFD